MKYEMLELCDVVVKDKVFKNVRQIRALKDIPRHNIQAGDFGGYVENETNLSQEGDCWIEYGCVVSGLVQVFGSSYVTMTPLEWYSGQDFYSVFVEVCENLEYELMKYNGRNFTKDILAVVIPKHLSHFFVFELTKNVMEFEDVEMINVLAEFVKNLEMDSYGLDEIVLYNRYYKYEMFFPKAEKKMIYYNFRIDFKQGGIDILFSTEHIIPFLADNWYYTFMDMSEEQSKFFNILCGTFAKSYIDCGVRFSFHKVNIFHTHY